LRFKDDLSLVFFVGLKNIIGGISVAYIWFYGFTNAFERIGTRTSTPHKG